jgi:nucleoside-diphosphate-sugar epimerase
VKLATLFFQAGRHAVVRWASYVPYTMAQRPTHYPHQSVLLVGPSFAGSPLALLAEALREAGWLAATSRMPSGQDEAFALCRGHGTIVLVPETATVGHRGWVDTCTRGTYDLLCAACDTGGVVERVVVLSTLDIFTAYPQAFKIGADWQPRPSTNPEQLGPHLMEFVAREFARSSPLAVVIARLGHLDDATQRFWVSGEAAMLQLVDVITTRGPVDVIPSHHRPGKYRILHVKDPTCDVLPVGQKLDVVAADAATAALADPRLDTLESTPAVVGKVLLLGANGMLGPPVVNALGDDFALTVTDVNPYGWRAGGDEIVAGAANLVDLIKPLYNFHQPCKEEVVDIADADAVEKVSADVDATVNCAVLRPHPKLAFDVNTTGTYNAIRSAVANGHSRFINTGPHHTVIGGLYEDYDYAISTDVPPHPGLDLYSLSKGCGQEICRVFSENHPIHVLLCLFLNFKRTAETPTVGEGTNPHSITFTDAANIIRAALTVDLTKMPSKCETFYCTSTLPHGRYSNRKTKALLGWEPEDLLTSYYLKPEAKL